MGGRIIKLMHYIKPGIIKGLICLSLAALILAVPQAARPSVFWSGQDIAVNRDELIEDDIYIFQTDAEIMGRVNGDVSALAQDFFHNGEINGNLNVCAIRADVEGTVAKSLRALCNDIQISGEINGNVLAAGNKISVRRGAIIGQDITCAGGRVTISGECGGDVEIAAEYVVIAGSIVGNIKVKGGDIQITDKARIAGDFVYESFNEAIVDESAHIGGKTQWTVPEEKTEIKIPTDFPLFFRFAMFLLALVTGYVFILLFKRHTRAASEQVIKAPGMAFAVGILTYAVVLIGGIIFFALLIGIPVALMLFCFGIALFYIGKIYVAIGLGRLIFVIFGRDKGPIGVEFLIGLIVLSVLFSVSILGWIIYVLVFIVGGGAAVLGYLNLNKQTRKAFIPLESPAPGSPGNPQ
jgi:cytoskeletal protein CcmA (bactofilin family)